MNKQYAIPKGAKSFAVDIAETTDENGKKVFELTSITYYGSPDELLEIQLGDSHVETKGYQGIKK